MDRDAGLFPLAIEGTAGNASDLNLSVEQVIDVFGTKAIDDGFDDSAISKDPESSA